jgi:hypothetical protein
MTGADADHETEASAAVRRAYCQHLSARGRRGVRDARSVPAQKGEYTRASHQADQAILSGLKPVA